MSEPLTIVSISNNTDIKKGWRVRCFVLDDPNKLGRTIAEDYFKNEHVARLYAKNLADVYNATLQG